MTTAFWIILAVWLTGALIAAKKVREFPHAWYEKAVFIIAWPLVLLMYIIYLIHNKL